MKKHIKKDDIIKYLQGLKPQNALEFVKSMSDARDISVALLTSIKDINAKRTLEVLQTESVNLSSEVDELNQYIDQINEISTEQSRLLVEKEELLKKKAVIDDITGQRREIEALKQFHSNHDLAALKKDLLEMKETSKGNVEAINGWLKEASALYAEFHGDFFKESQEILKITLRNRDQLNRSLRELTSTLQVEEIKMTEKLAAYDFEVKNYSIQYNDLANQLNSIKEKLLEMKEKHGKNIDAYETHLAQNVEIWGELGKEHKIEEYSSFSVAEIEKQLEEFDGKIKELISKVEHLKVY